MKGQETTGTSYKGGNSEYILERTTPECNQRLEQVSQKGCEILPWTTCSKLPVLWAKMVSRGGEPNAEMFKLYVADDSSTKLPWFEGDLYQYYKNILLDRTLLKLMSLMVLFYQEY